MLFGTDKKEITKRLFALDYKKGVKVTQKPA